jgi:hypothetical protein
MDSSGMGLVSVFMKIGIFQKLKWGLTHTQSVCVCVCVWDRERKEGDLINLFLKKEIRLNMPLISIGLSLDAVIMQVKYLLMHYELSLIVSVLPHV